MKNVTLMVIVTVLLTVVTAEGTDKSTIFAIKYHQFYLFRPPYQLPIDVFDLSYGYIGLAYDGDYWWIIDHDTLYQFDYGGKIVSIINSPAPEPRGLTFDGTYLWVSCEEGEPGNVRIYQIGLDGTPGPMGDFPAYGHAGLTFFQGDILTLVWEGYVRFYNQEGSFIRELEVYPEDSYEHYTSAITNDGTYLWINIRWEEPFEDSYIDKINPETGEYAGEYLWAYGTIFSGLAYADWTYTEVEAESIGRIKAFFR
jgi:hypothetical protein